MRASPSAAGRTSPLGVQVLQHERFDLLGNSLAILTGIASLRRARRIIDWTETQCRDLRRNGELAVDLPPCLMPYIQPGDPDWRERYERFNLPATTTTGASGRSSAVSTSLHWWPRASTTGGEKFAALTDWFKPTRKASVAFGFNEWIKASNRRARGAGLAIMVRRHVLYAAECVKQAGHRLRRDPQFSERRRRADDSPLKPALVGRTNPGS